MPLYKTFQTEIGITGAVAKVTSMLYLDESSTAQVKVGIYLDQAHLDAEGSKPMWSDTKYFDCRIDPESAVPLIQQIEEDLIARFDAFSGATRG